ncbi:hypothetical protein [Streptomyces sp. NPDC006739]|uniref:hypothetical protein n=1 Tax=Streptomyces sp. NPDC006739 TaxID=3364763 RepID=UPI00368B87C6
MIGTATVRQELPISPNVPPLPPHLVQLGFDYILAVESGDDVQAARLAPEVEQLPGLLPGIAELIELRAGPHRLRRHVHRGTGRPQQCPLYDSDALPPDAPSQPDRPGDPTGQPT